MLPPKKLKTRISLREISSKTVESKGLKPMLKVSRTSKIITVEIKLCRYEKLQNKMIL